MIYVRPAAREDRAILAGFVQQEAREAEERDLDEAATTAAVNAALADPTLARYWILVEDERPLGAIAVVREWSDWSNAAYWWIQFVYLVPEARGQGHLARLIDVVAMAARTDGSPELRLYVHPENRRAIRAYERLGFGRTPYIIMSRPIAEGA